jgi:hypothetical protein
MKPYFTRLAERAAPPREIAPIKHVPVEDPFASVDADVPATDASATESWSHREANVHHETFRLPTAAEQPIAPPTSDEMPVVSPADPRLLPTLTNRALTPARAPRPKNQDEEVNIKEERITPEPLSTFIGRSSEATTDEDGVRSMPPPASRELIPTILRSAERKEDDKPRTATKAEGQKPVESLPLESDLLRLADRFMEGLQRRIPRPTERDTPEQSEPPPLLPPRDPELRARQSRAAGTDSAPTPSVHIGSLRVEVISPPAAPAEQMRSPAPRIIRHGSGRSFGRGVASRQQFGLRQL